jgi:hypothetical protein
MIAFPVSMPWMVRMSLAAAGGVVAAAGAPPAGKRAKQDLAMNSATSPAVR